MQGPIVLLHGWGMNRAVWQPLEAKLKSATGREVVALDLPGFGDAGTLDDPADFASAVNDLQSRIPLNATLVAWSMAGLYAMSIQAKAPKHVHQTVLVGSSPLFQAQQEWPGISPPVLAQFRKQLTRDINKTIERFLAIQAMGSSSAKADIKTIRELVLARPQASISTLEAGLGFLADVDLRDTFKALGNNICGIFGCLDALVPVKAVPAMQKLNPEFIADVIEKASHAPFISHPDAFVAALLKQLK